MPVEKSSDVSVGDLIIRVIYQGVKACVVNHHCWYMLIGYQLTQLKLKIVFVNLWFGSNLKGESKQRSGNGTLRTKVSLLKLTETCHVLNWNKNTFSTKLYIPGPLPRGGRGHSLVSSVPMRDQKKR